MKIKQRFIEGLIYGSCLIAIKSASALHILADVAVTSLGFLGIIATTVFIVVDSQSEQTQ